VAVLIASQMLFLSISFSQVLTPNGKGRGQLPGDVEIMLIKIFTDENNFENLHNIRSIISPKTKLEILGLHFDFGI